MSTTTTITFNDANNTKLLLTDHNGGSYTVSNKTLFGEPRSILNFCIPVSEVTFENLSLIYTDEDSLSTVSIANTDDQTGETTTEIYINYVLPHTLFLAGNTITMSVAQLSNSDILHRNEEDVLTVSQLAVAELATLITALK